MNHKLIHKSIRYKTLTQPQNFMNLNKTDKVYHDLLQDILDNGHDKGDRTGTGTKSVYGRQIRFNMKEGFPLISTKKLYTRGIIHELLWFLQGDTNIKYLVDNNVNIWNEWPHQKYVQHCDAEADKLREQGNWLDYRQPTLDEFVEKIKTDDEFAKQWGDLGPVYGKQWVSWNKTVFNDENRYGKNIPINQIQNLIERLNTAPDCRRMIVSAWNVADLPDMALMPCHYGFQVWTRELTVQERKKYDSYFDDLIGELPEHHKTLDERGVPKREISLMWNQRSVDTFLGLPFNIASYGFLLEMIAQQTNMVAGELIGNLGDTHLYSNHIEYVEKQLKRESHVGSKAVLNLNKAKDIFSYKLEDFEIKGYTAHKNWKGVPIAV